jgi:hypothetical protein
MKYKGIQKGKRKRKRKELHTDRVAGPVVRIAPNLYSFSQPEDSKVIYNTAVDKTFTKTHFYNTNGDPAMPNIFNMKDERLHSQRKRKLAGLYNMSTMVHYETAVEVMNQMLLSKLDQYATSTKLLNLPELMQFYAFDVIGKITVRFSATHAPPFYP